MQARDPSKRSVHVGASVRKVLNQMDIFGEPMPGFHIRGSDVATSSFGGCVSFLVLYLTVIFATLKF